jgi:hypothetical protein
MRKIAIIALLGFSSLCLAQNQSGTVAQAGPAAPPEVDQALRARVTKFFQAHVDGKFRLAEQVIAEDSKDIYYAAQKPRYLKFEISKITYSDHFTKATVIANCDREMSTKFGTYTINVPQESYWKIEGGEWCWYVDPDIIRGPFGDTRKRSEQPVNAAPNTSASVTRKGPSVDDVLRTMGQAVKADKTQVRLSAQAPSDTVVISNSMPGAVTLTLQAHETPGLTVKLEKEQIGSKESGRVLFSFKPPAKAPQPVSVNIQVEPTGQVIPIQVQFGGGAQPRN